MAVIRLGRSTSTPPARRVRLGLVELAVLRRAMAAQGVELPGDLVREPTEVEAALAGADLDALLAASASALREHGVLLADPERPGEHRVARAVAANLAALSSAPRRVRTSLAGPDADLLAYHWTDGRTGGSLVREGRHVTLSLFDARALGDELLGLLPDPDDPGPQEREAFVSPLEELAALAAIDPTPAESSPELDLALAEVVGVDPSLAAAVRSWSSSCRAVLHVTVPDIDPRRLPHMLVWFVDHRGWWSTRTWHDLDRTRMVGLEPCRREDLVPAVGVLMTEAWW